MLIYSNKRRVAIKMYNQSQRCGQSLAGLLRVVKGKLGQKVPPWLPRHPPGWLWVSCVVLEHQGPPFSHEEETAQASASSPFSPALRSHRGEKGFPSYRSANRTHPLTFGGSVVIEFR